MPSSKLDFLSRLPSVEVELGVEIVDALRKAADEDDWAYVKSLIGITLEEHGYVKTLDHLYSLIPGQQQ